MAEKPRSVVGQLSDERGAALKPSQALVADAQHATLRTVATATLLAVVMNEPSEAATAALLSRFGGLRRLCRAGRQQLKDCSAVTDRQAGILAALAELFDRFAAETLPAGQALQSPADTCEFLTVRLRDKPFEVFCCLYLDNRHRVIRFEELFRGTIDGASVYPREVVRAALAVNAAAVILAHNHPSGLPEPSKADQELTVRLRNALGLIDIRLLDHIVVGDGHCVSMADRGLI
ncbi:MAG: DNA repair protein RadC [Pseudomonadota bacterium]